MTELSDVDRQLVADVKVLLGDASSPHFYDRDRYHAWAARYGVLIRFDARLSNVVVMRFCDGRLHRVTFKVRFV